MLTQDDLDKMIISLKNYLYSKNEMDERFYTKAEMDQKFSALQTSLDAIVKNRRTLNEEHIIFGKRISYIEGWVEKAAKKINLDFKR